VFGSQISATTGFQQIQRNHWHHLTDRLPTKVPPIGSYKIAMQFRGLMLLVDHWSDPATELMIAAGIHVPLWPLRQVNLAYHFPIAPLTDGHSVTPLDQFCRTLGVCDATFSPVGEAIK